MKTLALPRRSLLAAATALLVGALAGATLPPPALAAESLKVGVISGSDEEIWEVVKEVAAEQGLEIEIVPFQDYAQPNAALDAGDLDANSFQHHPYLDNQVRDRGYDLVAVADTYVAPFGFYSRRIGSLQELAEGARIGIPNDPSNGGRALLLLQEQGLLTLAEGVGITPSVLDIVENPRNLEIVELDAAQLPRSLEDLDAAGINTNYAQEAGLQPGKDSIAIEKLQGNPYANLIAVQSVRQDEPVFRTLVEAYHSERVRAFIVERYQGAIVPVW